MGQSGEEEGSVEFFFCQSDFVFHGASLRHGRRCVSELHKQGADLYGQKKYSEAIAALEKAVQSEDSHSPAYFEFNTVPGPELFFDSAAGKSDFMAGEDGTERGSVLHAGECLHAD